MDKENVVSGNEAVTQEKNEKSRVADNLSEKKSASVENFSEEKTDEKETAKELERQEKEAEKIARKIVGARYKNIDAQKKLQKKEKEKLEKLKRKQEKEYQKDSIDETKKAEKLLKEKKTLPDSLSSSPVSSGEMTKDTLQTGEGLVQQPDSTIRNGISEEQKTVPKEESASTLKSEGKPEEENRQTIDAEAPPKEIYNPSDDNPGWVSEEEDNEEQTEENYPSYNDEYDSDDENDLRIYYEMGIDSALLARKIAEVEEEYRNERDLKESEKGENEALFLKIKVPACRYLNEVIYKRKNFEFIYQFDFFIHYFDHRFYNKKRLYDLGDSTRVIAKEVMELVGNTTCRKTDFNKIIDSIGILYPNFPVATFLDSVMTELNLEYLATGEIKIHFKKANQRRIYARFKPSDIDNRSLGFIKFYTQNKKSIIENLDASRYDSLLPKKDSTDLDLQLDESFSSPNQIMDSTSVDTTKRNAESPPNKTNENDSTGIKNEEPPQQPSEPSPAKNDPETPDADGQKEIPKG